MPGDRIEMIDDHLYVNGIAAHYERLPASTGRDLPSTEAWAAIVRARNCYQYSRSFGDDIAETFRRSGLSEPIEVKAGHYFMMGDNRDDSNDSRFWGTVDRGLIVGRATMVVMSLDHEHYFEPRWHRFFSDLL